MHATQDSLSRRLGPVFAEVAALSHRPFQHAQERQYSWLAIALQALQLVLVAQLWAPQGWSAEVHLWWLAGTSAIGLLVLSAWMLALPRR